MRLLPLSGVQASIMTHLHGSHCVDAYTAEHDEKQQQAQAAAQAAAGVVPASVNQPEASVLAPKLPPGLKIPSMPKGWKPGMPIPGNHTLTGCIRAHYISLTDLGGLHAYDACIVRAAYCA